MAGSLPAGGHGALLCNLDGIDGDIVFIKNIDNIVPDRLKDTTVLYKKILGGYLVGCSGNSSVTCGRCRTRCGGKRIGAAARFATDRLSCALPPGFEGRPLKERQVLIGQLNRPLRVCGMVKNEGEPGGGPFWVAGKNGGCSLQIVEEVQVDRGRGDQAALWASSTHFNPVDLVCGIRDFRGRKSISSGSSTQNRYSSRRNPTRAATSRRSSYPGSGTDRWPTGTPSLSRSPSRPSTP